MRPNVWIFPVLVPLLYLLTEGTPVLGQVTPSPMRPSLPLGGNPAAFGGRSAPFPGGNRFPARPVPSATRVAPRPGIPVPHSGSSLAQEQAAKDEPESGGLAPPGALQMGGAGGLSPPGVQFSGDGHVQTFDPWAVRLAYREQRWTLMDGQKPLKSFDRQQTDAWRSLRLIRDLRLTQRGTIGTPQPVLEYWLSDGKAPTGRVAGARHIPFEPEQLRVEAIRGQWCLRDARKVLFNFGLRREDAQTTQTLIRKFEFNEVAVLGQVRPGMILFLKQSRSPLQEHRLTKRNRKWSNTSSRSRQGQHQAEGSDHPKKRSPSNINPNAPASQYRVVAAVPPLDNPTFRIQTRKRPFVGLTPAHHVTLPGRVNQHRKALPASHTVGGKRMKDSPLVKLTSAYMPRQPILLDWRQAQLKRTYHSWQLMAGPEELASFGHDERAARLALQAVRHYRFTEFHKSSDPEGFSYFLVNGKAPQGAMPGLVGTSFHPVRANLRRVGQQWAICSGQRVVFNCGTELAEARRILKSIQQHRFDRVYHIEGGSNATGMTFLARTQE